MNKPVPAPAASRPPATRRSAGPMRIRRRRLPLSVLAAAPLVLIGLVMGGASARTARIHARAVFAPKQSLRLASKSTFRAHSPWVRTLAFDPRGDTLASGGSDGKLHTWNVASEVPVPDGRTWSNPQGDC